MRAALLVLPLLGACSQAPAPGPVPFPPFALYPVASVKVSELEARVAALPQAPSSADDPATIAEQADGLAVFLSSASGGMADAAFDDVKRLGDAAIAPLIALFHDETRQIDERRAALRLVGELKSPAAVDALVQEAESNSQPALRALAAWKLGMMGDDACVPPLLKRLRYEAAPEVEPWLARTLAEFDNYQGVEALSVLATWNGPGSEAAMHLNQLTQDAGFVGPDPDHEGASLVFPGELIAAWDAGDPDGRLPLKAPRSDRYQLAVWHWVSRMAEFQLRGVDDARYILAHLRPEQAAVLATALHDDNRYIRTHVCQAIGRMGARGRGAAPELAAALGDPTLAPIAVESLAAVLAPTPGARGADLDFSPVELITRATEAGRDVGLRLAAVRALGVLGDKAAKATLQGLRSDPTSFPELHQAATESLAALGEGRSVARELVAFARDDNLDATTSLRALRAWIAVEATSGAAWATELASAWDELAPSQFVTPTPEAAAERKHKRLALVEAALAQLEQGAEPERAANSAGS